MADKDFTPAASAESSDAEFYVGYFKMPARLTRFLQLLVPAALLFSVGLAIVLARSQNDPGDGRWDTATARTFEGWIEATPYPLLRIRGSGSDHPVETLLLVEIGKFGGGRRALPFAGRIANVSGWIVERDGRRLLELEPGDSLHNGKPEAADVTVLQKPAVAEIGRVTLRGEIVDSKCYLGVMKPGEGKTHKECATLCIAGGIPPMLVTRDEHDRRTYYLLTDPDGKALDGRILPLVADPVEISGRLERQADLLILKINPADIRRL